ncbi:MAG: hypothetical protein ACRDM0_23040 [Thermoleophilaceae bacterium]
MFALALALPATATAGKLKLRGAVTGAQGSSVQVTVTKKGGDIGKITKLKFKRVPLNCQDGQGGAISGSTVRSFGVRGRDFTRKTRISGLGIRKGYFRVAGKFRRGGKVAKGSVRFAIKRTDGVGCGTGDVRWKARK